MTERPGYDFRGRQIAPATRADWRHDARPTNYDSARVAVLNRRIIELLDALDEAEADLAQAWADGYNHAGVDARKVADKVRERLEAVGEWTDDDGVQLRMRDGRVERVIPPGRGNDAAQ